MELTEQQIVALVFVSLQCLKGNKSLKDEEFDPFYQMYRSAMFRYEVRKKELDKIAGKDR